MRYTRVGFAGLAALATLLFAAPAWASVTVTPGDALQGDGVNFVFKITNDSATASVVKVEMQLPLDTPIAEVYPLSADNWAPMITERTIDQSVATLHGIPQNEVTSAVIWTAMPGKELAPGRSDQLTLTMGPLPSSNRLAIGVILTNSDGTVVRYTDGAAPAINLKPGDLAAAHAGHGTDADTGTPAPEAAPAAKGGIPYGGLVLATMLFIAALTVFSLLRQRHSTKRASPVADDAEETAKKEDPVLTA